MANATYYFADGSGQLQARPVAVDEHGTLTNGEGRVVVTGATPATVPADGVYVFDDEPESPKPEKKKRGKTEDEAPPEESDLNLP